MHKIEKIKTGEWVFLLVVVAILTWVVIAHRDTPAPVEPQTIQATTVIEAAQ